MLKLTPTLLLAALAACAISEAKNPSDVNVTLSSVTLGENCNLPPPPPPPAQQKFSKPPPASSQRKVAPGGGVSLADCARENCGRARACTQTSMQIVFTTQQRTSPTTIKVKKVELLDSKGNVLEVLTASVPTLWQQNAYVAWDEKLGANATVRASYRLTAPNWNKHTGGRMRAHAHTFQLRVTVSVGTAERTIEKQSITPARIEPMVVT